MQGSRLAGEPEKRFMDQGRRLKRVIRTFSCEVETGQPPKLSIKLIEKLLVRRRKSDWLVRDMAASGWQRASERCHVTFSQPRE